MSFVITLHLNRNTTKEIKPTESFPKAQYTSASVLYVYFGNEKVSGFNITL